MSEATLHAALAELIPDCAGASGDWEDVLHRAGGGQSSSARRASEPGVRRRPLRWTRRRVIAAGIAALLIALVATPAFGIGSLLLDLIGRTNVPFTGAQKAPFEVRRDFFDLTLFSPPGLGPQAIASQARRVGIFHVRGRERVLYVAPTREGGYCWIFTDAFGGCHATRPAPRSGKPPPGTVKPSLLGLTWIGSPIRLTPQGGRIAGSPPHARQVGGDLRARNAHTLQVEYEDESTNDIPFIYVSKPIDAGFFLYAIPKGHERPGSRARAVRVLDLDGKVLARQRIVYVTRRDLGRPPPPRNVAPPVPHAPRVPPLTPPLQQGEAGGAVVTAGRNGVALFDTSNATSDVQARIGGRATYACFSFMRYHRNAPASLGYWRTIRPRVAIRVFGLRRPFDGCEIQAGYGHVWPDRNGSHSLVEVAFTARGERYFTDRAAARDLALFVRSDEMHRLRKLTGDRLRIALERTYGSAISELPAAGARLRAGRVGYVFRDDGVTFLERSATGRLFTVVITRGRIVRQNVKPLALVF